MDHVVYLDAKAKEMDNLLNGNKSMIIRGAAGRKLPYGRVNKGDVLYLINNNGEGKIKAQCIVKSVYNSEQMTKKESIELIDKHKNKLQLTEKQLSRWAGKRYIVLIEVNKIKKISSFAIDKTNYKNMDDWIIAEDVNSLKK